MSVRILQFGLSGQLGQELIRQADGEVEIAVLSRADADLANAAACAARVRESDADLVVIAAAYTAVDLAETERDLAFAVNAETPAAIAAACAETGKALVNFSTDYVFDGTKASAYLPGDPTAPLNVYGASKQAGEAAVLAACDRALILRTSWVVSAHGKNFVKTMLRLARGGQSPKVVDDQVGRPTSAADLAGFVLAQAQTLASAQGGAPVFGLHHFANAGETSWRGLAQAVFDEALGDETREVAPIATADWPTPAARPARGVLDTTSLEATFGVSPRPWRAALSDIIGDLAELEQA
ncbi:dTDP-4-dehydrorhamnose reductase [Phenylobacterium immobile]|uniref:dTDP-4-dehydrorhamnose reductase n=1 Tax=Phenylobacterium immobile TaxID=21 RepID=UPI000A536CFB|nr:dTDP-4-dehydrorhamnose reductase [Phenylobacterium immobile]